MGSNPTLSANRSSRRARSGGLGSTILTRRAFVAAGGSFTLALWLPKGGADDAEDFRPSVWIQVARSGEVTFTSDRTDMGQGSPAALARIVADELEVPFERMVLAPMPDNPAAWPRGMGTGGSSSVTGSFGLLRQAAATAREMLRTAAAVEWGISPGECVCRNGMVVNRATAARLDYGELAAAAAQLEPPADPPLKDVSEFRLLGRPFPRPDIPPKALGTEKYAVDIRLPRQLTAVIARSPWPGSLPMRPLYERQAALNLPGVVDVFEIPGGEHRPPGVAVLAGDFWRAQQARDALNVQWIGVAEGDSPDSSGLHADFRRDLAMALWEPGTSARSDGNVSDILGNPAVRRFTAQYEVPFLSHATMEPMNCIADVRANRCEIWAPTQVQTMSQRVAARLTGLPADAVRIHTPALGGGFGRRLETDYVAEAVLASQHAGRPVQVMWTREDDTQHGYFRPAAISRLDAALDQAGSLTAWRQRIAAPSILRQMRGLDIDPDPTALQGAVDFPYQIANLEVTHASPKSPVNLGFWRSVAHSGNCFFVESFMDELAHAAGRDPYAFRQSLLADDSRMSPVLARAAGEAGWGTPLPPGSGMGLACSFCFGSYVAQVARVSFDRGRLQVDRIDCAVDCGLAVDPGTVEGQIVGGVIYGLTAALHGNIHLGPGGVEERNFDTYRMLLMHDTPDIRVHIVNSGAEPGGIGEVGVPPAAPAVGNAIFAALGKRLRQLPFELPPPGVTENQEAA